MFGKFIKSFKIGADVNKITLVLARTYSLAVSQPIHLDQINHIAQVFGESFNEHEMAVQFLAEFSNTIKTDHPKAKNEIVKYIRMAKGSYLRGLAVSTIPLEKLLKVARERFDIEPDEIKSA